MSNPFVSPEKIRQLEERMASLGIREADIEEKFIHARGRGGQKVNKTSACVYLRHAPTGIEVKCQESRSREANRFSPAVSCPIKSKNRFRAESLPEPRR